MQSIPQKLRTFIRESAQRHAWNMEVTDYQVDIEYMEKDKEDKEDRYGITKAESCVNRRYLKCSIRIYPVCYNQYKKQGWEEKIDHTIAHEVAHIATQHFIDCATARYLDDGEMNDAWEMVTERIARMSLAIAKLEK